MTLRKTYVSYGRNPYEGALLAKFARVDDQHPCPTCGRSDWCLIANDGKSTICARIPSEKPYGEAGWQHEITGAPVAPPALETIAPRLSPEEVQRLVHKAWSEFSQSDADMLAARLKLPRESLLALQVGMIGRNYCFPMVDEKGYCGVRFRSPDGKKWSLKGGQNGLFVPYNPRHSTTVLTVCEGPTDTAALLCWGLQAIGRPNCTARRDLVKLYCEMRCPSRVLIVTDYDKSGCGEQGAIKLSEYLDLPCAIIRPRELKDAREVLMQGGTPDDIMEVCRTGSNRFWMLVGKTRGK